MRLHNYFYIPATPIPSQFPTSQVVSSNVVEMLNTSSLQTCTRTPTAMISSAGKITVSPGVADTNKVSIIVIWRNGEKNIGSLLSIM